MLQQRIKLCEQLNAYATQVIVQNILPIIIIFIFLNSTYIFKLLSIWLFQIYYITEINFGIFFRSCVLTRFLWIQITPTCIIQKLISTSSSGAVFWHTMLFSSAFFFSKEVSKISCNKKMFLKPEFSIIKSHQSLSFPQLFFSFHDLIAFPLMYSFWSI